MRRQRVKQLSDGFVIYDKFNAAPYIKVVWPNKRIAAAELNTLLSVYSEDHFWRKRLCIKPTNNKVKRAMANHETSGQATRS